MCNIYRYICLYLLILHSYPLTHRWKDVLDDDKVSRVRYVSLWKVSRPMGYYYNNLGGKRPKYLYLFVTSAFASDRCLRVNTVPSPLRPMKSNRNTIYSLYYRRLCFYTDECNVHKGLACQKLPCFIAVIYRIPCNWGMRREAKYIGFF